VVTNGGARAALNKSGQLDRWAGYATAMLALGYQLGRGAALDPDAGYNLGHDVGYGANTGDRGFVRAVINGYSAGCKARHELAAQLLKRPPCETGEGTPKRPAPNTATPSAATTRAPSPG
jgi:hypothetical protein